MAESLTGLPILALTSSLSTASVRRGGRNSCTCHLAGKVLPIPASLNRITFRHEKVVHLSFLTFVNEKPDSFYDLGAGLKYETKGLDDNDFNRYNL